MFNLKIRSFVFVFLSESSSISKSHSWLLTIDIARSSEWYPAETELAPLMRLNCLELQPGAPREDAMPSSAAVMLLYVEQELKKQTVIRTHICVHSDLTYQTLFSCCANLRWR
jgi:hypothetical protein